MKPIKQTVLTDRDANPPVIGNCFQACVASLLELPICEVPHFCDCNSWPMNFHRWLEARGLTSVQFSQQDLDGRSGFWGYHIIAGPSPRHGRHGVIGYNGEIVFDPHPSNEGLLPGDWAYTFIFEKRRKSTTGLIPQERAQAISLANRVLDRPGEDPDSDLSMLSRQFLRAIERERNQVDA